MTQLTCLLTRTLTSKAIKSKYLKNWNHFNLIGPSFEFKIRFSRDFTRYLANLHRYRVSNRTFLILILRAVFSPHKLSNSLLSSIISNFITPIGRWILNKACKSLCLGTEPWLNLSVFSKTISLCWSPGLWSEISQICFKGRVHSF